MRNAMREKTDERLYKKIASQSALFFKIAERLKVMVSAANLKYSAPPAPMSVAMIDKKSARLLSMMHLGYCHSQSTKHQR